MYAQAMTNQAWRTRLIDAVEKSGRAETAICEAAGLRHAWFGEMINRPTDPKISYLLKFIGELGVDPAYIFSGVRATPQTLELLQLLQEAPPDVQSSLLTILGRSR